MKQVGLFLAARRNNSHTRTGNWAELVEKQSYLRTRLVRVTGVVMLLIGIICFLSPDTARAAARSSNGTGGGNWNATGTWAGGVVPVAGDDVTIVASDTVTVNAATASLAKLTVNGTLTVAQSVNVNSGTADLIINGTLTYNNNMDRTITVTGNLSIASGATFNTANPGGNQNHVLNLAGNLTNDGTFNCINGDDDIQVTFNGSANQTVSGTGGTTSFSVITINNSGAANNNIVEVSSTNFSAPTAFLTLTDGILKLSGSYTFSNTFISPAGYTIPAGTGIWLNNSNVTVTGQNGSPILAGLIQVTSGTYNIGTTSGNSLRFDGTAGAFTMEGGSCNIAGRFNSEGTGTDTVNFTMSGGTLTVNTVGNASANAPSFDLDDTGCSFTMSGGTIVLQRENSNAAPLDYRNIASTVSITGGTVQFGNASTPAAASFEVASTASEIFPSLSINATVANTVRLAGAITVRGNVTINTGTTLNANNQNINVTGNSTNPGNWTNSGTFTAGTGTVTFDGSANQSIGGSSTTFNNLTISNSGTTNNNVVSLMVSTSVGAALAITDGVLKQGGIDTLTVSGTTTINNGGTLFVPPGTSPDFTSGAVTVNSGGGWEVFGGTDGNKVVITLSSTVTNAGLIRFDSGTSACGENDNIQIRSSVSGTQRTWSGAGTFSMQDVDVKDQNKSGAAITVGSGTNSGNNTNWTVNNNCNAPTAVALMGFGALKDDSDNVLLQWKTGYEVNNLGFNLYRDAAGQRTRINPSLIAGSALLGRAGTAFTAGFSYAWMDKPAASTGKTGATYWLEDIDVNGTRVMHGPIAAMPGGKLPAQAQSLLLSQLQTNAPPATEQRQFLPGRTTMIANPTGNLGKGVGKGKPPVPAGLQTQWNIAGQPGVKLLVKKDGWYRVTQAELAAAGFDVTRDPFFMQLYVDGEEVPFRVNGGATGRLVAGDSIEFYGKGIDTTYANQHAYYLINGAQAGRRIPVINGDGGDESRAASFDTTIERRDRSIYFSGLKNGETENWFGAIVTGTPVSQTLKVAHLDTDSAREVTLEVALQGVFDDGNVWPDHAVKIMLNGEEVGTMSFDGLQHPVNQFVINSKFIQEGDNTVTLQSLNGSMDINLIDYVRLTFGHLFEADNNALLYTASGREMVSINGFSTAKVRVYDLTDPNNITELQGDVQPSGKSYRVTVAAPDAGQRVLYAVGEKALQPVAATVANQPSSWNKLTQGADVLIITHKDFASSVAPLKALRQAQGYAVAVVDVEDLYDEFNYGAPSPQAIKDFLTRTTAWKKAPRYAVLVGDASFDPKNYLGLGANDFVPTRMLETLEMEAASDDWLADFDGDDVPEIALGRLPVRTAADATLLIQKIIAYEQEGRPEGALLVSDRNDGFDFEATNASVKSLLPDGMTVTEVKRSQMTDTSAHQAIVEGISRGPKVVNYAGHGSFGLWRGNLLVYTDVAQMGNGANLPFVITMTCLNGQYNSPYDDSLAEALMKAPSGGAIAVWASSSLTMAASQPDMDQELIRQLFTGFSATGNHLTFGEAVRRAKLMTGDSDIRRSWILFGDPTTKLR